MLINCPKCAARVDAESLSNHQEVERDDGHTIDGTQTLISLLRCPSCDSALISKQLVGSYGVGPYGDPEIDWTQPMRVWPIPETTDAQAGAIPMSVAVSLNEARGCLAYGFIPLAL